MPIEFAAVTLSLAASLVPLRQDPAPAATGATWSQAELERISEEIKGEIAAMRGMDFRRPVAVKLADKKGFLDYARKRQEISMTPGRIERDEHVAKLLGLIPTDMDLMKTFEDFLEDQVGGFYDPSSDTFFLMDSFTGGIAKVILAHELTHALDDQHFDIDGTLKDLAEETDAELAFQSVVEGSGTAAMNQWTVKHLKDLEPDELVAASSMGSEGMQDAPPYIWKPLLAVYLRGEGFLTRSRAMNFAMKAAKVEDIRHAFENPPRSTEQILHPEKYWDPKKRDEPRKIRFDTAGLPPEWKVIGEDTLGELFLALVTTPVPERRGLDVANPLSILGVTYTNEGAEGWGGDRLLLLAKGEERCLDLVTVWDTLDDAREFAAAVRENLDASEKQAEIVQSNDPPTVEIRVCASGAVDAARMPRLSSTIEERSASDR